MISYTPNSATWTSTVAWAPTVELLGNILKWWPLQALAFVAKIQAKVMTNGAYWQDACQLFQGIDEHSPLQGIPESVLSGAGILVSPEEINPDMDVEPTGSTQLVAFTDGFAHSYDFRGHYAGSITQARLRYLRLDHALSQKTEPAGTTHGRTQAQSPSTAASLPDVVHALLVNKGLRGRRRRGRCNRCRLRCESLRLVGLLRVRPRRGRRRGRRRRNRNQR